MIYECIVAPVLAIGLAFAALTGQMALLGLSANAGFWMGMNLWDSEQKSAALAVFLTVLTSQYLPRTSSRGLSLTILISMGIVIYLDNLHFLKLSLNPLLTLTPSVSALLFWSMLEEQRRSLREILFWSYNTVTGRPNKEWAM